MSIEKTFSDLSLNKTVSETRLKTAAQLLAFWVSMGLAMMISKEGTSQQHIIAAAFDEASGRNPKMLLAIVLALLQTIPLLYRIIKPHVHVPLRTLRQAQQEIKNTQDKHDQAQVKHAAAYIIMHAALLKQIEQRNKKIKTHEQRIHELQSNLEEAENMYQRFFDRYRRAHKNIHTLRASSIQEQIATTQQLDTIRKSINAMKNSLQSINQSDNISLNAVSKRMKSVLIDLRNLRSKLA